MMQNGPSQEQVFHHHCEHGSEETVLAMLQQLGEMDEDSVSYFVNRRNSMRYTPLMTAIFARNLGTLRALVNAKCDVDLKCHGTPVLHLLLVTASLPEGYEFASAAFTLMLQAEKLDLTARDDQLSTALHVAAECNLTEQIKQLLALPGIEVDARDRTGMKALHRAVCRDAAAAAKLLVSASQLNSQTPYGCAPLHIAAAYCAPECWKVLVEAGASASLTDCWGHTPQQVAVANGWEVRDKAGKVLSPAGGIRLAGTAASSAAAEASTAALPTDLSHPTAIISHPICRRHYTCEPSMTENPSAPPENVKRLKVIIDETSGALHGRDLASSLQWVTCRPAAMADVLRVHEWPYVRRIQAFCETIAPDAEGDGGIGSLDGDTTLCHDSFTAALCAAGAVTMGVDMVCNGTARNAFAPVRPPGHHAGPKGLVRGRDGGPDSHGFCLLNNVSIGAAYAMNVHRDKVKRVAIVDFDVHHGNGTEETIRWLKPGVDDVSILESTCFGSLALPHYKPWFDSGDTDNVLFVSVHGYGPREKGMEHLMPHAAFYPGTGKTVLPAVTRPVAFANAASSMAAGSSAPAHPDQQQSLGGVAFTATKSSSRNTAAGDGGAGEDDDDDDDDDEDEDEDRGNNGNDTVRGRGGAHGGADEEDEEEDDDEDGGGMLFEADGNEEQEEEGNDALEEKLFNLRRTYTRTPKGSAGRQQAPVPPLILDVGVPLPGNAELQGGGAEYRHQWRNYFREHIFSSLMTFQPDLIFISAGFDAHKKDTINGGYIALVEEDFEWVTHNLVTIANATCEGRVVSVLEGGYMISGEHCSAFAKSVKAHVAALAAGARGVAKYSAEEAETESRVERRTLDDAAEKRALKMQQQAEREAAAREARRQAAAEEMAAQEAEGGVVEAGGDEGDDGSRKRRRAQVTTHSNRHHSRIQTPFVERTNSATYVMPLPNTP